MEILENIKGIMSNWTSVATIIGMLIIFFVFIKVKKVEFTSRLMAHIAITLAMTVVLEMIKIIQLPFGGSASIAGMLPIILISLIYGPIIGIFTGFLYGILNFIIGPAYILHPIQVLFDYILPFMAVGLSGFFKNNKYMAIAIGFFGMFIFNFIAGVVFWGSYAADYNMTPVLYSIVYNGSFILPDCLICMGVASVINIESLIKRLKI
ncbi:MAG: energy-coupled thiamine transporter ThiT [Clostridiales bacterium]|jgi:thiamine transporter|nr:energy-coupled thiamine transporter ThiT [Clostridiales bacterium]